MSSHRSETLHIGVDVGGTFTDVVCLRDAGGFFAAKVPSTPGRAHVGVVNATAEIVRAAGAKAEDIRHFIHGTTVATNAIIEHKGARVGILMTDGFEDTLEIGRYKRAKNYDVWFDVETPVFLAPRRRRKGIVERLDFEGNVLIPLDEDSVRAALTDLVERQGVEAIAVCYLFSFENEAHEVRTAEIAHELYPDLGISLSCKVNPEIREYERLCITAFDAYIRPVVGRYLSDLTDDLRGLGVSAPLQVMESRGGIADARLTIQRPSATIMSGPAAGVIGALRAATASGYREIISIDVGGTSSDVSLAVDGNPLISREGRILTYPVRTPMVDVTSIGAGGGSVAWFDAAGGLHVGPQSAGAEPGPACYGRGGTEATVTDASVVLGYVNPEYFAGGAFSLDPALAAEAVGRIAEVLRVSALEAAWGIHRIVNAGMTDQIRLMSVGRGHDPRRFALVLLGGAGPLHGCKIAEELGISTLVVPALPGVLSAFGLLVSDVDFEQTRTFKISLDALSQSEELFSKLGATFSKMDGEGFAAMQTQGIAASEVQIGRFLDVRYVGQSFELEIALPRSEDDFSVEEIAALFADKHERVYGHARHGEPVEILNLRSVYRCPPPPRPVTQVPPTEGSLESALKGAREIYFGGDRGLIRTPVYDRAALPGDAAFEGPAVVEQLDTTVLIHPGWRVRVDGVGHIVIERGVTE
jgi:N-methylhydantoinase A